MMKIERIEALPLTAKMKPLRIATTTFTECRALIVRITTSDGLVGIGESLVRSAPRATKAIVEETFAPLLLGKDPSDAAGLWWDMFSAMRTRGHTKGNFVEALSGVDMALWDIIGKANHLPLYKALHGFGRKTLPAYGSSIFMGEVKEMEAQARKFLDLGYTALKIKIGMGAEKDEAAVAAIRSMVGKSIELMVDANSAYDARTAVQIGRRLEKYDLVWFEEPVPPYDLKGYREVKRGQGIPIAAGEGEFTLFGFRDLLATEAVDVVQPDAGRMGGLTEGMRIAALIQAQNLQFAPHTGMSSAVNIVAGMHYAAAAPNFLTFEFMELDHPLIDIFRQPMPRPKAGRIELPEAPGLGVDLDQKKIERWIEK
jgi:L-alanine-DL-glutamate epimerase-like enolase superfamily enzyme